MNEGRRQVFGWIGASVSAEPEVVLLSQVFFHYQVLQVQSNPQFIRVTELQRFNKKLSYRRETARQLHVFLG